MTEQQVVPEEPKLGVYFHPKSEQWYLVIGVGEIDYEVSDYSNQGMSSIGLGHYSEDLMVRAEIRVRVSASRAFRCGFSCSATPVALSRPRAATLSTSRSTPTLPEARSIGSSSAERKSS